MAITNAKEIDQVFAEAAAAKAVEEAAILNARARAAYAQAAADFAANEEADWATNEASLARTVALQAQLEADQASELATVAVHRASFVDSPKAPPTIAEEREEPDAERNFDL